MNAINRIKSTKYISLITILLMFFTYLTSVRYYINTNIFKSFNLGNIGAFGTKLVVSVICVVFMALAFALGALLAYFTRKRAKNSTITSLYFISGVMAFLLLMFNPYNFQLLIPSLNLQNLAMFSVIAVMVFTLVDMIVFAWVINLHIAKIAKSGNVIDIAYIGVAVAVALVFAVLTLTLKWSFTICITVYSSILMAVNIVHALISNRDSETLQISLNKQSYILAIAFSVIVVAMLLVGYFVTEPMIAMPIV